MPLRDRMLPEENYCARNLPKHRQNQSCQWWYPSKQDYYCNQSWFQSPSDIQIQFLLPQPVVEFLNRYW